MKKRIWVAVLFAAAACSHHAKMQTVPESALDETNQTTASEQPAAEPVPTPTSTPVPIEELDDDVVGSETTPTPTAPGTPDGDVSGDITDDETIPGPSEGLYAGGVGGQKTVSSTSDKKVSQAVATMVAGGASKINGTIRFADSDAGVTMQLDLKSVTKGAFTLAVHEFGDCSAPDFSSAGEMVTDLGALPAATTKGTVSASDQPAAAGAALNGATSIVGHAIVLKDKDDKRLACGVVGIKSMKASDTGGPQKPYETGDPE